MAAAQTPFTPAWSSYVGGNWGVDGVYALASDGASSYLGGSLAQCWIQSDPPVDRTQPFYGPNEGGQDAFVAKLTSGGTLAWYICLGYIETDRVTGLAVGPDDRVFASGFSERTDSVDACSDAVLWSVNRTTGSNLWATSFGRANTTNVLTAVTVDSNGYTYAVGYTSLTGLARNVSGYLVNGTNFGTQLQGDLDACVLKVAPNGNLVWFHYLGGTNADIATACAVTPDGSVYVAGETRSPDWVSSPSGTPGAANQDGFLVKLTTNGAHVASTFFGGSSADAVTAIAKDPSSAVLFLGGTTASTNLFSGATRLNAHAGSTDGFVVKLTDTGTSFQTNWCRFFGGSTTDRVTALTFQAGGGVVAGGTTASGSWLTQKGSSAFGGVQDGFISQLASDGSVVWSSYVGGSQSDEMRALATAPNTILSAGSTLSSGWVGGGFWSDWDKIENQDFGFVAKWSSEPGVPPAITNQPSDATVQEGQPATFRVLAQGSAPLTYRWLRNGELATGITSNTYVIAAAARTNNQDTYSCLVSNTYGTATSLVARLTVISNGTLTVTLSPANALAQGAAWSINSGATWFTSGAATNLAAGTYAVSFTNLTGWTAPASLSAVHVSSGGTTSTSGVYTAFLPSAARSITGTSVSVIVRAPAGVSTWELVETLPAGLTPISYTAGGAWNSGAHTLTFSGAEATTNTFTYDVSCVTSGAYTVSGTVTPHPANVPVAVTGDSRIIKANLIRTIRGNQVTLSVYQPDPDFVWSIYEKLPVGLTPTNILGSGYSWNATTRTLRWFSDGAVETLGYGVAGNPGTYTYPGTSYGNVTGANEPIFGDTVVTIPNANIPAPNIVSLLPAASTNAFNLTFISVANQTYMIITNATVSATNLWSDCLPVTGEDGTTTRQVPISYPRLFYRVRVVQ